jgi:hypothetical protein
MYSEEQNSDINRILEEALKSEPDFRLPDNFADLMAEKISRKMIWQLYIAEFLIYFGALVGLAGVTAAIQFVFFGAKWQVWVQFITNNIPVLGGLFFLLIFVLFSDRVLLRYFMYRGSLLKE